jgi:formylglycine-generating enzyme required for sulfatase activity
MGQDSIGELDERPAHEVEVRSFLLDRTEVTNAAYAECVAAKACRKARKGLAGEGGFGTDADFGAPNQPVSGISWSDARAYCAFRGKRLPTEAEWERAARGQDERLYPWGNEPPDETRAVFAARHTASVCSVPLGNGPFGHCDLAGNVWEWLDDDYDPLAYSRPSARSGLPGSCAEIRTAQNELRQKGPRGFTGTNPIPTGCDKNLRGGAFNYFLKGLRSSNRVHHPASFRMIMAGVRCAADAPQAFGLTQK